MKLKTAVIMALYLTAGYSYNQQVDWNKSSTP